MIDQRYLNIIENVKLSFNDFIILILIYEEQYGFLKLAYDGNFMDFTHSIRYLEERGLVKWHGDNSEEITLRKAGEDLFKKYVGLKPRITNAKEVQQWIHEWREIFPEGVNTAGFRYRGDKAECVTKMIKFINRNNFTLEQIFEATRDYVDRFSQKGYAFMQQAHYFIEKRGVGSTLAAECEGLTEDKPKEEGESYGRAVI